MVRTSSKGLAGLMTALAALGIPAGVIEIPRVDEFPYENDVRCIHPRTYAEIMKRPEFSKAERDLVTVMFHRSGSTLFTSSVIGFSLECNVDQFERMRRAFPEECLLAEIVRDRGGRFTKFMDKVTALDVFMRSAPDLGQQTSSSGGTNAARTSEPRDN